MSVIKKKSLGEIMQMSRLRNNFLKKKTEETRVNFMRNKGIGFSN